MITTLAIFFMVLGYGRFLIALLTMTVGYNYVFSAKEQIKIQMKGGRVVVLPWLWLFGGIASHIVWWYQ